MAILIVNWNVRGLLARCLRSVQDALAGAGLSGRVLVVDNASSDGSPEMLRQQFPQVELLVLPENRGFAGGVNAGLAALSPSGEGVTGGPRCVLLLNPDVEVPGGAIPALLACLEAHPRVGVVGPRLRYPDGSVQSSRRRFPTEGTLYWESTPLEQLWPANPWVRRYRVLDYPVEVEQDVDWLVGACLLVRGEALAQTGPLDEGFFLYFEELEWCRRIKQAGWRVLYCPTAQVIHHEGRSSEQVPLQRQLYFQRSKLRYARQAFGPGAAGRLRLFLLAMYAWQWLLEGAKWLLGHRRALRAERMGMYGQILRTGLKCKE